MRQIHVHARGQKDVECQSDYPKSVTTFINVYKSMDLYWQSTYSGNLIPVINFRFLVKIHGRGTDSKYCMACVQEPIYAYCTVCTCL